MTLVGYALLAIVASLPGIALRGAAAAWQKQPLIEWRGENPKQFADRLTLLSWNVCCVAGGYTITDGGVTPWSDRIERIIDRVIEKNADVNCLYETFDFRAAHRIAERLKKAGYQHIYYNIGPQAVGVSSGILVASRYRLENPEFTRFPLDTLVGRTKNAAKGVFGFDVMRGERAVARIFATHLQHSEICSKPNNKTEIERWEEERRCRAAQMKIVVQKVNAVKDRAVIVTGDLNLDDEEYDASRWQSRFTKGTLRLGMNKTWGGDHFCAQLVGKQASDGRNYDHTMAKTNTVQSLETDFMGVGYDSTKYQSSALSDHAGLFSTIRVKAPI